jgi:cytochrome c
MRIYPIILTVAMFTLAFVIGCAPAEEATEEDVEEATEETTEETTDEVDLVAVGAELFADTELGTSGMSCNSCHLEGGTVDNPEGDMPTKALIGVKGRFPGIFMMRDAENESTLVEAVNFCITMPLKGEALEEDSEEMQAMIAYLESL